MLALLLFVCVVAAADADAAPGKHKVWTLDEVIASIEDPPLRDIFASAGHKLAGLKADTDLKEIERSLRAMVTALRRRIAVSFKAIRSKLFLDEPIMPPKNVSADKGGNSTELHDRPRPVVVDHIANMDSFFRTWIPAIKKDIEMSALVMNKLADNLGPAAHAIASAASAELRRIPLKYGRLRRKLTEDFSRTLADDHHEMHKKRVIQSECGKPYTVEQFVELFDHDHNLQLTEESFWTPEFTDEFYEGWPVFATQMRLQDPACGSKKWSLPPQKVDKSEL